MIEQQNTSQSNPTTIKPQRRTGWTRPTRKTRWVGCPNYKTSWKRPIRKTGWNCVSRQQDQCE